MKRAVIFLNGTRPSQKRFFEIIKTTDTIICADGGIKHALFFGLMPEIVIGDFDSTPQTIQKRLRKEKITLLTFPTNKDKTDSELTLEYVIKKGFTDIVIFAADGDRTDHVLANILFFATLRSITLSIVTTKEVLSFVSEKIILKGKKGDTISLIPLQKDVTGILTTGLVYPLKNETLYFGKSRGVSNVFSGNKAEITLKKGTLLVIQQL